MSEWKKYEASRNAPRPVSPPPPKKFGGRDWVEVILGAIAIAALVLVNYVVPARSAELPCGSDSECMEMHGGDGDIGPLVPLGPVRLKSGAILKFS